VTGFPEFPNTSPSGKRVDSDDPIPRTFQNFSKKRHPRNVEGTHVIRKPRNGRIEARSQNYPPCPYKYTASAVKIFSPLSCFVANCISLLRGKAPCDLVFAASNFRRTFLRYYSLCLLPLVSTFHRTGVLYFANFIHECRLYCLLFVLLSNRWLELKVLQDP
jgi:hypothetical protein